MAWTIVYVVTMRKNLINSEATFDETLMYVASTVDKAVEWCKRNLDLEEKTDPSRWWWFTVHAQAIDGDYSGVHGVVTIVDWNGDEVDYQPINGYGDRHVIEDGVQQE